MPSIEIEHPSDRAFHISGKSLEELFREAARVMYSLMGRQVAGTAIHRRISLEAADNESLLVMYLSELLSIAEVENLAALESSLHFEENSLQAELTLFPITHKVDYIKAVTFSELNILNSEKGVETNLIFDT
ncbi:MAG: archease [Anaerolineaceae bacterium]